MSFVFSPESSTSIEACLIIFKRIGDGGVLVDSKLTSGEVNENTVPKLLEPHAT